MNKLCIYITGLPASGKTTLANKLSEVFGFKILDKDLFLEVLFEEKGIGDAAWRSKLSREADVRYIAAAKEMNEVILGNL